MAVASRNSMGDDEIDEKPRRCKTADPMRVWGYSTGEMNDTVVTPVKRQIRSASIDKSTWELTFKSATSSSRAGQSSSWFAII